MPFIFLYKPGLNKHNIGLNYKVIVLPAMQTKNQLF